MAECQAAGEETNNELKGIYTVICRVCCLLLFTKLCLFLCSVTCSSRRSFSVFARETESTGDDNSS